MIFQQLFDIMEPHSCLCYGDSLYPLFLFGWAVGKLCTESIVLYYVSYTFKRNKSRYYLLPNQYHHNIIKACESVILVSYLFIEQQ